MHDTDGISSHCRVKNSTLLCSRVEFQIKSFCFFTVYLTGGTSSRQGCFFVWLCHARLEFSAEQPSVLFCTIRMRLFRPENEPWRKTQFKNKEKHMKKLRTTVSVIIMILAGIAGFFAGSAVTDGMGGAILFSMIAGIGCIVYTADNRD